MTWLRITVVWAALLLVGAAWLVSTRAAEQPAALDCSGVSGAAIVEAVRGAGSYAYDGHGVMQHDADSMPVTITGRYQAPDRLDVEYGGHTYGTRGDAADRWARVGACPRQPALEVGR